MGHHNMSQQLRFHDTDLSGIESAGIAALVGGCKECHEMSAASIDSGHEFYEPGPLDNQAKVAKVVDRTNVVVN